jgi:signal transduction histidine kinase
MKRMPLCSRREDQGAGVSIAGPRFTIDAALGLIVEANAAGWDAWGLDGQTVAPPVAVDRAMPAVQRLAELAGGCRAHASDTLAFWTARGVRRLRCKVRRTDAERALFSVEVLGAAPGRDSSRDWAPAAQPQDSAATVRLAHELRTPLSAVIAYAEILKDEHFGPMANARYRDYARNIFDSARHALGVVDGMLGGAGRPDKPEFAFRDLDPAGIVENCLAVVRPLAEQAGLELGGEVAPHVPRIVADEVSLKQMLLNLLTNAIKFARRGDRVTVRVTYDPGGPLCIAVADTGPGMSQPPLALQGGKGGRNGRGTRAAGHGIGLPLTRALAEANGASLLIDSAPERGTLVTIAFGKDRVVPV